MLSMLLILAGYAVKVEFGTVYTERNYGVVLTGFQAKSGVKISFGWWVMRMLRRK